MIYLELDGRGELYRQLHRALKRAILQGRLAAGSRLPPTRALSSHLGLSRNTVLAAYEMLCTERLASARGGSGTFVADGMAMRRPARVARRVEPQSRYAARLRSLAPHALLAPRRELRLNLQYGEPIADLALFGAWARSLSHAATRTDAGYPPPAGLPALREAIASHLGRSRGVDCTADDVIVVNGTQQAVSLVARVLLDEGDRAVLEDPAYALAARCLQAHGAALHPVPVDDEGLRVDLLPRDGAKLVVLTPSHQFVSGVSMSVARRTGVLRYAAAHRGWIVEDDYDGEFGGEARALPALRSLDVDDRVIYVGSFSKTLFPALRLGYLVAPRALHADLVKAKLMDDIGCSGFDQLALAHFMQTGGFDRHLRRTALELRRRRRALHEGLARHCGDRVRLQDSGAGMHCIAWLPGLGRADMAALIERAAGRGLGLHDVAVHYAVRPPMQGLVLGIAGTSAAQLRLATRILGDCLGQRTDTGRSVRQGVEAGG